jgi:hypothetical protein
MRVKSGSHRRIAWIGHVCCGHAVGGCDFVSLFRKASQPRPDRRAFCSSGRVHDFCFLGRLHAFLELHVIYLCPSSSSVATFLVFKAD